MDLRWISVAFMLFYSSAVFPSCTGDVEERPELIPISSQGLSDSPMIGDEGTHGLSDASYTMADLEREDMALRKEEADFKQIKDRFSRRLFEHQTEKLKFEKYKSETEENLKKEEVGKEGEEEELEAALKQLDEEEKELKEKEDELDKAEKEIQKTEATLNGEMDRIKDAVNDLKKKEDDLETLIADLETKKKELEDEFIKQEIIEQKKHGECVDIPEGLKRFLKVSERENGKICNPINQNDDNDDKIVFIA